MASTIEDWLALALLPHVGPLAQRRALEVIDDPGEIAYRLPIRHFGELGVRSAGHRSAIARARKGLAAAVAHEMRLCKKEGITVVPLDAGDYPSALREIPDPPVVLFRKGEWRDDLLRIAIVGSRNATRFGKRVATGLGDGLAARGIEVVSGGARGVDTMAHRGALEARGRTVAVLGSGLVDPYPRENGKLFARIAETGVLLTEFPPGFPTQPGNFPRRNRLISGVSAAVVVVEAAERSGSLSTAKHALDQGRDVMAVPGSVENPRAVGCHRLIREGAQLVQNIEDILSELPPEFRVGLGTGTPKVPEIRPENLAPDQRVLWELLDPEKPTHLDELASGTLFGIPRLQAALFALDLEGVVEQLPGGYWVRRY